MKNAVATLLEDDHQSLAQLLKNVEAAFAHSETSVAYQHLDLFWARLAMHIRAEHLYLFPALTSISEDSIGDQHDGSPEQLIAHLRADHDFFMKELADMIKTLRASGSSQIDHVENLQHRLKVLRERLEQHNLLEEENAYVWPAKLLEGAQLTTLTNALRLELENLPPRFSKTDNGTLN